MRGVGKRWPAQSQPVLDGLDLTVDPGTTTHISGRNAHVAPASSDPEHDQHVLRLRQSKREWRQVEDKIVALDLDDSTYSALNRTGAG